MHIIRRQKNPFLKLQNFLPSVQYQDHASLGVPFSSLTLAISSQSGLLNFLEKHFYDRGHFRRLPVGLLGILRPGKGEVKDFVWLFGLREYGKGLQEHGPLALAVMAFADRTAIWVFNRGNPRNPDLPTEFRSHRQDHR